MDPNLANDIVQSAYLTWTCLPQRLKDKEPFGRYLVLEGIVDISSSAYLADVTDDAINKAVEYLTYYH